METPRDPGAGSADDAAGSSPTPPPPEQAPPPAAPPPPAQPAAPPPAQAPAAPPASWAPPAEELVGPAPGYQFGGPGERLVAYIVDSLIVGVIVTVIAIVGGLVVGASASAGTDILTGAGAIVLVIALIVVPLAYFPWFWARRGATPGMRMFNLKVVRDRDGGPISGGSAILRLIGYWVDWIVFGIPIGLLWIFYDKRKRAWHDLIASTVVVKAAA
jgi:uncharacterized RDD family membrane protein YckC